MKFSILLIVLLATLGGHRVMANQQKRAKGAPEMNISADSVLRHVVLFKFKEGTSAKRVNEIKEAFANLRAKIPQIHSYEDGVNNSLESLNKGFTHCFQITFLSEDDRAIYLTHPDHIAFGDFLGSDVADVLVIDYWN